MENTTCCYRQGPLPRCAPLALAVTPMQDGSTPAYDADEALARGTLFPGLDLPLMDMVNNAAPDTPLKELMALSFAAHELHLYLDTHADDAEAFTALKGMLSLAAEAKRRYVERYGPLTPEDLAMSESFDWLDCPWPWAYQD